MDALPKKLCKRLFFRRETGLFNIFSITYYQRQPLILGDAEFEFTYHKIGFVRNDIISKVQAQQLDFTTFQKWSNFGKFLEREKSVQIKTFRTRLIH